ncbi:MAG TPA: aminotransferase class V-fold PLP-dependent enzyme [Flavilitoribacter sp.]|nr:aminotransferase class V-fold PLP-dependent enzyme [Flavilitoribacter sp.]
MLSCQKHLFSIDPGVSYLNCAYMSPQLNAVEQLGIEMMKRKSRPWTIQVEDFFEPCRLLKDQFAKLVHIDDPGRVALIPSASYGLANVARNIRLKPGQKIVVAGDQFPSNYYPWQRIAREAGARIEIVPPPQSGSLTDAWNAELLKAVDEEVALVAMANVHWANGIRFDLEAIREKTAQCGALLIIDGTQSVGALPFDVDKIRPDALIVAGYKWLLGPYSLGLGYYGPAFDQGIPIEENWINRKNSEDFRRLVDYQDEYQPKAGRYSIGEQSNFVLLPMLTAAIGQLLEWGVDQIQGYCTGISAPFADDCRSMGIEVEPEGLRCGHLFGLRFDPEKLNPDTLKAELAGQQIHVSFRGDSIRVAPHVYNTPEDLSRLGDILKSSLKK